MKKVFSKTYLKAIEDAQKRQDEIFKKMPADRKIKLACELSSFCMKLNSLNGNNRSRKTAYRHS